MQLEMCRIQSTACEQQKFEQIVLDADPGADATACMHAGDAAADGAQSLGPDGTQCSSLACSMQRSDMPFVKCVCRCGGLGHPVSCSAGLLMAMATGQTCALVVHARSEACSMTASHRVMRLHACTGQISATQRVQL
jgi:hypothetical protein